MITVTSPEVPEIPAVVRQAFLEVLEDMGPPPPHPTVTGLPGDPPVVFEDPSLPHQIMLLFSCSQVAVSCNCLGRRDGVKHGLIERRPVLTTPAAIAAWRGWHAARGVAL